MPFASLPVWWRCPSRWAGCSFVELLASWTDGLIKSGLMGNADWVFGGAMEESKLAAGCNMKSLYLRIFGTIFSIYVYYNYFITDSLPKYSRFTSVFCTTMSYTKLHHPGKATFEKLKF